MNKDEVKGGAEKVGGKIKEQVGKVTGDPVTEQKGRNEQVKGELRQGSRQDEGRNQASLVSDWGRLCKASPYLFPKEWRAPKTDVGSPEDCVRGGRAAGMPATEVEDRIGQRTLRDAMPFALRVTTRRSVPAVARNKLYAERRLVGSTHCGWPLPEYALLPGKGACAELLERALGVISLQIRPFC